MTSDDSSRYRLIEECEAAIGRIRAAIRAGNGGSEAVGEDLMFVQRSAAPSFIRYARSLKRISGTAFQEAFDAMNDRLLDDIWSPTFPSLETGFGIYLKHMSLRILQKTARNYRSPGASSLIEHLDETVGEDGLQRHEYIADERAEQPFNSFGESEEVAAAIQQLPPEERQVVAWRLDEIDNQEIARRLGVSSATATRIYQRAISRLQQRLHHPEE